MSNLKIYLVSDDGTETVNITDYCDLSSLQEVLKLDEASSTVTFSTSSELSVLGGTDTKGYELLRSTFFDCGNGGCLDTTVECKIEIGCCDDRVRTYSIEAEVIEWCVTDCSFNFVLLIDNSVLIAYDYLNDTYFWAEETGWVQQLTEDQVFRFQTDAESITQITGTSSQNSESAVTLSYNLVNVIKYHLNEIGVILDSNVANQEPYSRVTFAYDMYYKKDGTVSNPLWGDTKPEVTALDLIDNFAQLTNSEYRIISDGGQVRLVLKRKDLFSIPEKTLSLDDFIYENSICIGYVDSENKKCRSMRYDYEKYGTFDFVNETKFIYNEFISFNINSNRTERCETVLPFHAPYINDDESIKLNIDDVIIPFAVNMNPLIAEINPTIVNGGLIVVWSGGRDGNNIANIISENGENYNYPLFFDKDRSDGLYQSFFFIDNPDETGGCGIEIKDDLELLPSEITFCEVLDILDEYGVNVGFTFTSSGCDYTILAKEIKIDYNKKTITLQDTLITN